MEISLLPIFPSLQPRAPPSPFFYHDFSHRNSFVTFSLTKSTTSNDASRRKKKAEVSFIFSYFYDYFPHLRIGCSTFCLRWPVSVKT